MEHVVVVICGLVKALPSNSEWRREGKSMEEEEAGAGELVRVVSVALHDE